MLENLNREEQNIIKDIRKAFKDLIDKIIIGKE